MTTEDDERVRKAQAFAAQALQRHRDYRGKITMAPKCPVRGLEDLAHWYTPGVAEPCRAIVRDPSESWQLTNRANQIAIVSDGTRVLGLGNIGPEAGMPVMEGKALLFKVCGAVDAVPLCVRTSSAQELVDLVCALEPSFGAINLEDIEQPKCFAVLDALRDRLQIPVWHDDQQGTATVTLAAVRNALEVVGKSIGDARFALIGIGAANVSVYRLLRSAGVASEAIVACDTAGILHLGREDLSAQRETYPHKWEVCCGTDPAVTGGGIEDALRGADVCIAFSHPGPGTIEPAWVRGMAQDAIVFACANPVPEIWPWQAREAGAAIVATGRSDFDNQLNNSLGFPGIFRGVLDVRARSIPDELAIAAAQALGDYARRGPGLSPSRILPSMDEWHVVPEIAAAVGARAEALGLAQVRVDPQMLRRQAHDAIERARAVAAAID
jgi:malate dehydrogenase (oxaloacetate-decarboxylating)